MNTGKEEGGCHVTRLSFQPHLGACTRNSRVGATTVHPNFRCRHTSASLLRTTMVFLNLVHSRMKRIDEYDEREAIRDATGASASDHDDLEISQACKCRVASLPLSVHHDV